MKIPFFYMDLGNLQIFQPQNDNSIDAGTLERDGQLSIEKHACPEIGINKLYLNGDDQDENMQICVNENNNFTENIEELIELLKTIEV